MTIRRALAADADLVARRLAAEARNAFPSTPVLNMSEPAIRHAIDAGDLIYFDDGLGANRPAGLERIVIWLVNHDGRMFVHWFLCPSAIQDRLILKLATVLIAAGRGSTQFSYRRSSGGFNSPAADRADAIASDLATELDVSGKIVTTTPNKARTRLLAAGVVLGNL